MSELVQATHLKRRAVAYIRQSTPHQVVSNQESPRLQYALRQRARDLGWHEADIDVIDADLGLSGAPAAHRGGFKELVGRVGLSEAGLIAQHGDLPGGQPQGRPVRRRGPGKAALLRDFAVQAEPPRHRRDHRIRLQRRHHHGELLAIAPPSPSLDPPHNFASHRRPRSHPTSLTTSSETSHRRSARGVAQAA